MTFIATIPEDQATGATAELYATDQETFGYLPNFTRAFSSRPRYTRPGANSTARSSARRSHALDCMPRASQPGGLQHPGPVGGKMISGSCGSLYRRERERPR